MQHILSMPGLTFEMTKNPRSSWSHESAREFVLI